MYTKYTYKIRYKKYKNNLAQGNYKTIEITY